MGWTSISFREFNNTDWTDEQMTSFMYGEFNTSGYEIVKQYHQRARKGSYDNNVSYLLMHHPNGYMFLMVVLVKVENGEIYWKEIDETMGPGEDGCPKEFIGCLPKTESKYANEWRARCLKRNISYHKKQTA